MTDASRSERELRSRWRRFTTSIPLRLDWWAEASPPATAYRVAVLLCLVTLPLDEALWRFEGLRTALLLPLWRPAGATFWAVLLALGLVNAWILDAYIEKTQPGSYRTWVLWARRLVCAVPLLGLAAPALGRAVATRRSAWAFGDPAAPARRQCRARLPGWFLLCPAPAFWLVVANFAVLFLGAFGWVHPTQSWTLERQKLLVGVAAGLHLLIAALLACHVRDLLRRPGMTLPRRALLAGTPLLFALPFPYLFLPGFALLEGATADQTVGGQLPGKSTSVDRSPAWTEEEDALRRSLPPPEDRPQPLPPEHARRRLYDLVALCLGLDAAALGWSAAQLMRSQPEWDGGIAFGAAQVALALAGLAVPVAVVHFLAAVFRLGGAVRVFDRHPYPGVVLQTQSLFAVGLFLGLVLARRTLTLGDSLLCCVVLLIAAGLRMLLTSLPVAWTPLAWRRLPDHLPWLALPMVLALACRFAFSHHHPGLWLGGLLTLWLALVPVRGWLLARTLLPALLRPCGLRQIRDRTAPFWLRRRLAGVALPVLLPWGGLALPLAVYLRHRRWEAVEAWWEERTR